MTDYDRISDIPVFNPDHFKEFMEGHPLSMDSLGDLTDTIYTIYIFFIKLKNILIL